MAKKNTRRNARRELKKDLLLILCGAILTVFITKSGLLDLFLGTIGSNDVAAFVTGIFFTSVFTIAPASIALTHIAATSPFSDTALWGAFGAMCGDIVIFLFIRDRFAEDLMNSLKPSVVKHVLASFHLGFMKYLSPIIGAFIIASPLPDEFGLTLLGLSKVRIYVLLPIAFFMNWLGIYFIVWLAHVI